MRVDRARLAVRLAEIVVSPDFDAEAEADHIAETCAGEPALADAIIAALRGSADVHEAERIPHLVAPLRALADALDAGGLTSTLHDPTRPPITGTRVATPGEFAALWNSRPPEQREQMLRSMQETSDDAFRCRWQHEGVEEQVEHWRTRALAAEALPAAGPCPAVLELKTIGPDGEGVERASCDLRATHAGMHQEAPRLNSSGSIVQGIRWEDRSDEVLIGDTFYARADLPDVVARLEQALHEERQSTKRDAIEREQVWEIVRRGQQSTSVTTQALAGRIADTLRGGSPAEPEPQGSPS